MAPECFLVLEASLLMTSHFSIPNQGRTQWAKPTSFISVKRRKAAGSEMWAGGASPRWHRGSLRLSLTLGPLVEKPPTKLQRRIWLVTQVTLPRGARTVILRDLELPGFDVSALQRVFLSSVLLNRQTKLGDNETVWCPAGHAVVNVRVFTGVLNDAFFRTRWSPHALHPDRPPAPCHDAGFL